MAHSDDRRLAVASRALRQKAAIRQRDLTAPRRSRRFVLTLEQGEAACLRIGDVRDHFALLGASVRITVYWNGAALDRTIDEKHARLVERTIAVLRSFGWQTESEVTFSDYGERGSIDVLGANEVAGAAFIGEIKSAWGSVEETNRSLDVKARLAPKIVFDRQRWRPSSIAKVLVLPDDGAARRIASRYRETLSSVYPARSREVRAWLRKPSGSLRGLWFLTDVTSA